MLSDDVGSLGTNTNVVRIGEHHLVSRILAVANLFPRVDY